MNMRPRSIKVAGLGARPAQTDPLVTLLLAVDLLLFAGGAITHSSVPIPFGVATWEEPLLVPAAVIEGIGAAGLAATLVARQTHRAFADRLAWRVLWYCFAGVMWSMTRLAMGSIPEARTETNDYLHISMTVVTTIALVRLAGLSAKRRHRDERTRASETGDRPRTLGRRPGPGHSSCWCAYRAYRRRHRHTGQLPTANSDCITRRRKT